MDLNDARTSPLQIAFLTLIVPVNHQLPYTTSNMPNFEEFDNRIWFMIKLFGGLMNILRCKASALRKYACVTTVEVISNLNITEIPTSILVVYRRATLI